MGLNQFINKVYQTTGLGFGASLAAAYLGTYFPILIGNTGYTIIGGFVASLLAFTGVSVIKPIVVQENVLGMTITKTKNPVSRLFLYTVGALGLGISASPLLSAIQATTPEILPASIAITTAIFGGASAMAYAIPKDSALGYGRILTGSLLGLISMQLIGLGAHVFTGPNMLSSLLFTVQNYAGIATFIGFVVYDTQVAIKQYESGNPDHLGVSVQLFLDFWNLLIRVLEIMAKSKRK